MDSFYKIGKKPTVDNYADYLAAFIKLKYKRRRVTIVGVSFGFVIATRMLQRYPELVKKVDFLVSAVGFMHTDDFVYSRTRQTIYRLASSFVALPPVATFFRYVCLNPHILRAVYSRTHNAKHKFAETVGSPDRFDLMMDAEIMLWHANDVRTQMKTTAAFFTLNNCEKQINLPVWHVGSKNDFYFNNNVVEQHMKVVFSEVHMCYVNMKTHAPSVLADKKESAAWIPPQLVRALSRK
jgi:pimeloyl-ACP methyl ester carboxylesterase